MFGYCTERKDFRLFKLNRLVDLVCIHKKFRKREVPQEKLNFDSIFTNEIQLIAIFDKRSEYRLTVL